MKAYRMKNHWFVAVLAAMLVGVQARAAEYYDMVCIYNQTDETINFAYRWGDGSWTQTSVRPGGGRSIRWAYDYPDEGWSPRFSVKFDADLSSRTDWTYYVLKPLGAETTDCDEYGHDYDFKYLGGSTTYIDLFDR